MDLVEPSRASPVVFVDERPEVHHRERRQRVGLVEEVLNAVGQGWENVIKTDKNSTSPSKSAKYWVHRSHKKKMKTACLLKMRRKRQSDVSIVVCVSDDKDCLPDELIIEHTNQYNQQQIQSHMDANNYVNMESVASFKFSEQCSRKIRNKYVFKLGRDVQILQFVRIVLTGEIHAQNMLSDTATQAHKIRRLVVRGVTDVCPPESTSTHNPTYMQHLKQVRASQQFARFQKDVGRSSDLSSEINDSDSESEASFVSLRSSMANKENFSLSELVSQAEVAKSRKLQQSNSLHESYGETSEVSEVTGAGSLLVSSACIQDEQIVILSPLKSSSTANQLTYNLDQCTRQQFEKVQDSKVQSISNSSCVKLPVAHSTQRPSHTPNSKTTPSHPPPPPPPPPPPLVPPQSAPPHVSRSLVNAKHTPPRPPPPPVSRDAPPPPPPPPNAQRTPPRTFKGAPPPPPPLPAASKGTPPPPPPPPASKPKLTSSPCPPPPPPMKKAGGQIRSGVPPPPPLKGKKSGNTETAVNSGQTDEICQPALKPTVKFHWNKLGAHQLKDTIWSSLGQGQGQGQVNIDLEMLEQEFACKSNESQLTKTSSAKNLKGQADVSNAKRSVLTLQRANNIEVFLRGVGIEEDKMLAYLGWSKDSVKSLQFFQKADLKSKKVDEDILKGILTCIPTQDEAASLQLLPQHESAQICRAEKFMLKLMQIQNVKEKIEVLLIKEQLAAKIQSIEKAVNGLKRGSEDVRANPYLPSILRITLALGNRLNHGTRNGSASGFKIGNLVKLKEVKATKCSGKNATLLHLVVRESVKSNPEIVANKLNMDSWLQCARINIADAKLELEGMQTEMQKVWQTAQIIQQQEGVDAAAEITSFYHDVCIQLQGVTDSLEKENSNFKNLVKYLEGPSGSWEVNQFFGMLSGFASDFDKAVIENQKQDEKIQKRIAAATRSRISVKPKQKIRTSFSGSKGAFRKSSNFCNSMHKKDKVMLQIKAYNKLSPRKRKTLLTEQGAKERVKNLKINAARSFDQPIMGKYAVKSLKKRRSITAEDFSTSKKLEKLLINQRTKGKKEPESVRSLHQKLQAQLYGNKGEGGGSKDNGKGGGSFFGKFFKPLNNFGKGRADQYKVQLAKETPDQVGANASKQDPAPLMIQPGCNEGLEGMPPCPQICSPQYLESGDTQKIKFSHPQNSRYQQVSQQQPSENGNTSNIDKNRAQFHTLTKDIDNHSLQNYNIDIQIAKNLRRDQYKDQVDFEKNRENDSGAKNNNDDQKQFLNQQSFQAKLQKLKQKQIINQSHSSSEFVPDYSEPNEIFSSEKETSNQSTLIDDNGNQNEILQNSDDHSSNSDDDDFKIDVIDRDQIVKPKKNKFSSFIPALDFTNIDVNQDDVNLDFNLSPSDVEARSNFRHDLELYQLLQQEDNFQNQIIPDPNQSQQVQKSKSKNDDFENSCDPSCEVDSSVNPRKRDLKCHFILAQSVYFDSDQKPNESNSIQLNQIQNQNPESFSSTRGDKENVGELNLNLEQIEDSVLTVEVTSHPLSDHAGEVSSNQSTDDEE